MPNNSIDNLDNSNDRITVEAASWIAQIDGARMSEADRLALAEWMARSPRHESEIRQLAAVWNGVDEILDELTARDSELKQYPLSPIGFGRRAALAATMSLAITAGLTWAFLSPAPAPAIDQRSYSVAEGDIEEFQLLDGSALVLNSDSVVEVSYGAGERSIRLLKGEALFDVEKDADRPFVVYAGNGVAEAIGTRFSVRLFGEELDLAVVEGTVRVSKSEAPDAVGAESEPVQVAVLNQGDTIRLSEEAATSRVLNPGKLNKRLAWLEHKIVFDGDPLSDAIAEISRYTDINIIISDPALRTVPLGGTFRVGELDAVMEALEHSLAIEVQYVDAKTIYLNAVEK